MVNVGNGYPDDGQQPGIYGDMKLEIAATDGNGPTYGGSPRRRQELKTIVSAVCVLRSVVERGGGGFNSMTSFVKVNLF